MEIFINIFVKGLIWIIVKTLFLSDRLLQSDFTKKEIDVYFKKSTPVIIKLQL